ncbi:MAG: hypothetical protein Q8M01_14025 [Rubrivivax sp.]|nr:hypothetical protein [Rubrivivax sp.]
MTVPHRYRGAVKALRDRFPDDELVQAIVGACEAARAYRPEHDPFKLRREELDAARDRRAGVANAARRLASACRGDDAGLAVAIAQAERRCAVEVVQLGARASAPPLVTATLARLLAALAEALDDANERAEPGAPAARSSHGNLGFERDIARGLLPATDTMLACEVEFYIRAHVAGRRPDVTAWRPDSLKVGRPHRDLVALFVTAALQSTLVDARAVQQRLREIPPRTRVMGWPEGMG